MLRTYRVAPIGPNQIDRVFPLVETVEPSLDLAAWRARCGEAVSRRYPGAGGDKIIVATDSLGYVQGLSVLRSKRILRMAACSMCRFLRSPAPPTRPEW